MEYIEFKDFLPSVRTLYGKGGQYQKMADKVYALKGKINGEEPDPLKGFPLTRHGESRIKNCRKYRLNESCRLVTVVNDDRCWLLYAGSHNDCEKWLNKNKGLVPSVGRDGSCITTFQSDDLDPSSRIGGESDFSYGKLYEKLQEADFDFLVEGVPRSIIRSIEALESIFSEDEICEAIKDIEDEDRQKAIYDVLVKLRQGDIKAASNRVALFRGDIEPLGPETEVKDSEDFRVLPPDSPRELKQFEHYIRTDNYKDWMMFMQTEQEQIANAEFAGPAKLTGVSGSGKTCIVVKRAITLAERYADGKILILTLNRPLSKLIQDLVSNCCAFPEVRDRIDVMSFFELCQEFLNKFEPENQNLYDEQTWKTKEHIDDVWREYYRLELNNNDAKCLQSVHDSLISKDIDAERYIREEFDWIRSAMYYDQRKDHYLGIKRSGRFYSLTKNLRSKLLEGLQKWEEKMLAVGITDYLGVTTALSYHRDKLRPKYRCILIDECQDFGTIELKLVVLLVEDGPNNLFFCGDAAQHVSWKHQSFKDAGIYLHGARSKKIYQNYRNNRNIMEVAYQILYNNLTDEMMEKEDFEILDPEFANFGGPKPLRLKADSLEDELAYSIAYASSELKENTNHKVCIAICGYSLQQIQEFGKDHGFPVLDGALSIDEESLFLSDLEQTKGFEFDLVCIVNVSNEIIPNPTTPTTERFRDLSKLYVAMTRARFQLILSHSGDPSPYIDSDNVDNYFHFEMWREYFPEEGICKLGVPPNLDQLHEKHLKSELPSVDNMEIEEFLYTPQARGLSSELIKKLRDVQKEKGNKEERWRLSYVVERVTERPEIARKHFGGAYEEFWEFAKGLDLL